MKLLNHKFINEDDLEEKISQSQFSIEDILSQGRGKSSFCYKIALEICKGLKYTSYEKESNPEIITKHLIRRIESIKARSLSGFTNDEDNYSFEKKFVLPKGDLFADNKFKPSYCNDLQKFLGNYP